MMLWVGTTDTRWFEFPAPRHLDEVNFWWPSVRPPFKNVPSGMPFVFKVKAACTCPTCNAEFETIPKDGVFQVTWAESTQREVGSKPMTEVDARELLSVSADADVPAIKAACWTACQLYQREKYQVMKELRRLSGCRNQHLHAA